MEVFDLQGTVDFFHDVKKYGFIQADDEDLEDDLFFHITDLEGDEIAEGDDAAHHDVWPHPAVAPGADARRRRQRRRRERKRRLQRFRGGGGHTYSYETKAHKTHGN